MIAIDPPRQTSHFLLASKGPSTHATTPPRPAKFAAIDYGSVRGDGMDLQDVLGEVETDRCWRHRESGRRQPHQFLFGIPTSGQLAPVHDDAVGSGGKKQP